MTWLMDILKIELEEQFLIKYFVIILLCLIILFCFNITKNSKYDGYQRRLASISHKSFDKKVSGGTVKIGNMSNRELSE